MLLHPRQQSLSSLSMAPVVVSGGVPNYNNQSSHYAGTNDYIDAAKTGIGASGSNYTWDVWLKTDVTAYKDFLGEYDNVGVNYPLGCYLNTDRWPLTAGIGGANYSIPVPPVLNTTSWYHVMGA